MTYSNYSVFRAKIVNANIFKFLMYPCEIYVLYDNYKVIFPNLKLYLNTVLNQDIFRNLQISLHLDFWYLWGIQWSYVGYKVALRTLLLSKIWASSKYFREVYKSQSLKTQYFLKINELMQSYRAEVYFFQLNSC